MPHLAVRHGVHDHDTWKNMFDEFAPHRRLGWELSFQIFRFEDAGNSIALMKWDILTMPGRFSPGMSSVELLGKPWSKANR